MNYSDSNFRVPGDSPVFPFFSGNLDRSQGADTPMGIGDGGASPSPTNRGRPRTVSRASPDSGQIGDFSGFYKRSVTPVPDSGQIFRTIRGRRTRPRPRRGKSGTGTGTGTAGGVTVPGCPRPQCLNGPGEQVPNPPARRFRVPIRPESGPGNRESPFPDSVANGNRGPAGGRRAGDFDPESDSAYH
jgi:hypothetical protein